MSKRTRVWIIACVAVLAAVVVGSYLWAGYGKVVPYRDDGYCVLVAQDKRHSSWYTKGPIYRWGRTGYRIPTADGNPALLGTANPSPRGGGIDHPYYRAKI